MRLQRVAFRTLERVAPQAGAAWADRIWFRLEASPPAYPPPETEATGRPFEVDLHGHTIRGRRWGKGPVVYLVHGWSGRSDQLRPLVPSLLERGLQVVAYDALSHGRYDPGAHGAGSSDAVELGHCLDAVAGRFGPARAVVAHSMGALSTVLALRDGWVAADRLVFLAPMQSVGQYVPYLRAALGFGDRIERRVVERATRRTGYPLADLDVSRIGSQLDPRLDLLVIHDVADHQTSHAGSERIVAAWPGARLRSPTGLGHRRILSDPAVVAEVAAFAAAHEPAAVTGR